MNFNNLPTMTPDIEKLKTELKNLCEQYAIVRFEPEDIIELLEDGEEVSWLVSQLQQDNANLDVEKLTSLLSQIAPLVKPPTEEFEAEEAPISEAEEGEPITEEEAPPLDLSQIDLSQLGPELEAMTGMKLPAGVDLSQIKKIMKSPQGAFLADFALFCQEQGIDMASVSDPKELQNLNEQWMAAPRAAFEGKTPAEIAQNDSSLLTMKKVETYRRTEPRVGRNDPCPCGSGKKYKKCCGMAK